jgi:hypothetical protein
MSDAKASKRSGRRRTDNLKYAYAGPFHPAVLLVAPQIASALQQVDSATRTIESVIGPEVTAQLVERFGRESRAPRPRRRRRGGRRG